MTTKTEEKTTMTKVEITLELMRNIGESLISAEWFYREEAIEADHQLDSAEYTSAVLKTLPKNIEAETT